MATLTPQDLRTLLVGNGFKKDKVFQDTGSLSGGERMRLAMLITSHQPDCLLPLDEPDNHPDISSKTILGGALRRFEDSYILVSHDADVVMQCDKHLQIAASVQKRKIVCITAK